MLSFHYPPPPSISAVLPPPINSDYPITRNRYDLQYCTAPPCILYRLQNTTFVCAILSWCSETDRFSLVAGHWLLVTSRWLLLAARFSQLADCFSQLATRYIACCNRNSMRDSHFESLCKFRSQFNRGEVLNLGLNHGFYDISIGKCCKNTLPIEMIYYTQSCMAIDNQNHECNYINKTISMTNQILLWPTFNMSEWGRWWLVVAALKQIKVLTSVWKMKGNNFT